MPPNPTIPTINANQTCGRLSAPSSVRGLVLCVAPMFGSQTQIALRVMIPMMTTSTNALRQPNAWPSHDAMGTPTDGGHRQAGHDLRDGLGPVAGPNRRAATNAAIPKNAPCGTPATNRATISDS